MVLTQKQNVFGFWTVGQTSKKNVTIYSSANYFPVCYKAPNNKIMKNK